MIEVFHIISHFDLGGAERVAINIAKSKSECFHYHIVEVVKSKSDYRYELIKEMDESGISYHCSPISNNKLSILLFPFWFIFIFLKYKPNIIHTHTEIPDLSIYWFSKLFCFAISRCALVRTIHNNQLWNKWKRIGKNVEKFYINKKSNIAISKSTQKSYFREYGEMCSIIFNGLNPVSQKTFPGIDNNKINVLYAARLEYQKSPDVLARIIVELRDNDNLHFYIIGDGSMKSELLSSIKGCNNFSYYNKIYGLSSFLSSFDYLFMPSKFEGLALMPIEASLANVPSIINDCVGLAETLPTDWPLKVSNNDIQSYINIFNNLTKDNKILGEKAFKYASDFFSMKNMQNKYEEFYRKSMNSIE